MPGLSNIQYSITCPLSVRARHRRPSACPPLLIVPARTCKSLVPASRIFKTLSAYRMLLLVTPLTAYMLPLSPACYSSRPGPLVTPRYRPCIVALLQVQISTYTSLSIITMARVSLVAPWSRMLPPGLRLTVRHVCPTVCHPHPTIYRPRSTVLQPSIAPQSNHHMSVTTEK